MPLLTAFNSLCLSLSSDDNSNTVHVGDEFNPLWYVQTPATQLNIQSDAVSIGPGILCLDFLCVYSECCESCLATMCASGVEMEVYWHPCHNGTNVRSVVLDFSKKCKSVYQGEQNGANVRSLVPSSEEFECGLFLLEAHTRTHTHTQDVCIACQCEFTYSVRLLLCWYCSVNYTPVVLELYSVFTPIVLYPRSSRTLVSHSTWESWLWMNLESRHQQC